MRGLVTLGIFLLSFKPGYAWWNEGHALVAKIAERMLTRAVRARIRMTLAPGESFTGLSTWADDVRPSRKETEPWHYVNIPLRNAGLDMRRDCPGNNCILGKITNFRKTWSNQSAPDGDRREALLFLVHLVGDLHQPLHCEDNGDTGGNDVPVRFLNERTNLHALWDGLLLEHMPRQSELLVRLSTAITPKRRAEWSSGTVEQWANESFHIAQNTVYGLLPPRRNGGSVEITAGYQQLAGPVIEQQLEKAGVRLAAILNGTAP